MMSPIEEMEDHQLWLIHLPESIYSLELKELLKYFDKKYEKIGYVCFNKLYADVVQDLEEVGIDTSNFSFIDVLSSHYHDPESAEHCIFINEPHDIEGIKSAIDQLVIKGGCKVLLVDTISKLLIYQQSHQILQFVNEVAYKHDNIKKLFISIDEEGIIGDENKKLFTDLSMFADKTILLDNVKQKI